MLLSRRHLPLNAMRAFEAAARHCHLRRAAEELGVTHGAVSRHVRQLEDLLGVALFDRSRNRMVLTSAGDRLLLGVQQGLDMMAESALYLDAESIAGRLVIASTPSISAGWLVTAIGEFSQRYPEMDISLLNIDPMQMDIPADVDVAICYGKPNARRREVTELYREKYFPVCSPQLLNVDRPLRNLEDVLDYPLLTDRHGHWVRWLSQYGINGDQRKTLYFQESFQVIHAVKEGFGIALVDRFEVARDLQSGTLQSLFNEEVIAEQSHYLVTDSDARMTVRSRLFIEHITRYVSPTRE
ncbi:MAG: LysR family transcriptional regulator [Agarilytica sp.]